MNRESEELERLLQDYLDGRMSAEERNTFEETLAKNEELRSRVEFLKGVGREVRRTPSGLPPGFHARARERFEASRGGSSHRGRSWTWQAVGLAAAALVLAAILIPFRREHEIPGAPSRVAPSIGERDSAVREEGRESLPPAAPAPRKQEAPSAPTSALRQKLPSPAAEAPPPSVDVPSSRPDGFASNDAASGAAMERARVPAEVKEMRKSAVDSLAAEALHAGIATPFRCEPIPVEASIEAGSLKVISDPHDDYWRELRAGPARISLDRLRPNFASERVAIIGPGADRASCGAVRVVTLGGAVILQLPVAASDGSEAPGGCAVTIPAGDSPVEVERGSDTPR